MKTLVRLLLSIILAVVVLTGFRWYRYVSNTDSPYDEVGITLNNAIPGPINSWGCAKLKTTFATCHRTAAPPATGRSGSSTEWLRQWRSLVVLRVGGATCRWHCYETCEAIPAC